MIEILVANIVYVSYRLVVSGPLVKLLLTWMPYYLAVLAMAQLSFAYDTVLFYYYFESADIVWIDLIKSNVIYTLRVIAAWWVIKQLWKLLENYWLAVFFGAQLTFVADYFIFADLFN